MVRPEGLATTPAIVSENGAVGGRAAAAGDRRSPVPALERAVRISRRQFLHVAGTIGMLAATKADAWGGSAVSGGFLSPFFQFDREIQKFMSARNVPGCALAVVKDRRLVYARGYGWADRENKVPAKPTSLFRIASLSKPFTAIAVLKLVERGKLDLKTRVFDLLGQGGDALRPYGGKFDERWKQITVDHLLHHTGGWDRDKSFDPMFRPREIAGTLAVPSPPGPRDIIRYMLGQALDFDPGARYAYSNFGYCVLGRVIEKVGGASYEKFVKENVLALIGIKRMRIGASLAENRAEDEVRYYMAHDETAASVFDDSSSPRNRGSDKPANPPPAPPKEGSNSPRGPLTPSLSPLEGERVSESRVRKPDAFRDDEGSSKERSGPFKVPWPYGGFCLESMDAHGGWIASAIDVARFAAALHDPQDCPLLEAKTIQTMHAAPEPPVARNDDGSLKDHYYGCGWLVRPVGKEGKANYWHTGSLPGTCTLLVRRWDGVSWAVLFNQRSDDDHLPDSEIDPALHRAANAVVEWPRFDLFQQYR